MKWEFGEYYSSLPVMCNTYFSVPKEFMWTGRSFGLCSASASRSMKGLVCVYEESEFALLNMSPLRWEHCQGKSIFRLNSFDNVPLSVFSPSSKNERTRSEPVEKGF